ncbi:unnamed protein product [Calypogeia fissa]
MASAVKLGVSGKIPNFTTQSESSTGCSTFRCSTPPWIGKNNVQSMRLSGPLCHTGFRRLAGKGKDTCPVISYVWRWTQIQLERSGRFPKQARQKVGLKVQSEAPSQHTPEASSKTIGDGAVKIVTGNSSSTATLTTLDVPQVVHETSSASTVVSEAPSVSPSGGIRWDFDSETDTVLSIIVIGATGELAKSKIFPALFALYFGGSLPKNFVIFGYSRTHQTDEDLRLAISERLTCRIDDQENCGDKQEMFLEKVFYQSGGYESCDSLAILDNRMKQFEVGAVANRIFYLSIPHDVVLDVASCLSKTAQSEKGWTRVIVEKPFGNDAESSAELTKALLSGFKEEQIYRIDHLMGKEIIENLTVLRFSNLVFEPLWCRTYIRSVQFIHSEDWGLTEGRDRDFDEQGIIRDIVQSHILQSIALFAMEPPVSLDGEDIRNEKVKVLRSMRRPTFPDDVALGQYKASKSKDGKSKIRGYLDEPDVNPNSLTPTFVATIMYIDNARWDGVPFLIKVGKGLIKHAVEIRIQFHHVPGNLYRDLLGYNLEAAANELILRVQPDEGLFLKINNKVPGLGTQLDTTELNLLFSDMYGTETAVPDSYERLILDVINGVNHLFIRGDELEQTWNLLSPLLKEIESLKVAPELYTFGGRGPIGAYYLGATHGVKWADE